MTERSMQSSPHHTGESSHMERPRMSMLARQQHDLAGIPEFSTMAPYPSEEMLLDHQVSTADPLAHWYNDGPWVPKGTIPLEGSFRGRNTVAFTGSYRESLPPSECDTVPPGGMTSDSGYEGSRTKRSIAATSLYDDSGDRCQDTQSLTGHFSDLHFPGLDPEMSNFAPSWNSGQDQVLQLERSSQADGKESPYCEFCAKYVKTNSELKKHTQRHTKPFICEVPRCARTIGFSTMNDLQRHKRSVHPEKSSAGDRFRCFLGPCRNKDKIWPRADNFKSHLKRVHDQTATESDLEKFKCNNGRNIMDLSGDQDSLTGLSTMHPSMNMDFQFGSGGEIAFTAGCLPIQLNDTIMAEAAPEAIRNEASLHTQSDAEQAFMNKQIEVAFSLLPSDASPSGAAHDRSNAGSPTALSGLESVEGSPKGCFGDSSSPEASCADDQEHPRSIAPSALEHRIDSHEAESPSTFNDGPSASRDISKHHLELYRDEEASPEMAASATMKAEDISSALLENPETLKKVLESLQSKGLVLTLAGKVEDATAEDEDKAGSSSPTVDHNKCRICDKTFNRPCELTKHLKRHDKPFGCTYEDCNKRFGSKNDWKRHENSQHFFLEVWRCDLPGVDEPTKACGRVIHRRETFKQHVINQHNLRGDAVDKKLEDCRAGRDCEARFWCGFCLKILEIKNKGGEAWRERFDHIGDHYAGRNRLPKGQPEDWKMVDPNAPMMVEGSRSDSECDHASMIPTTRGRRTAKRAGSDKPAVRSSTKRMKDGQAAAAQDYPVTICCQCGEGITVTRVSSQCVSLECQHVLCPNCCV